MLSSLPKTLVSGTRIMFICLALLGASAVADTGKPCSNRTLIGDYGFVIEGTILGPNLSVRGLAMQHYDGKGNITQVDHSVDEGNASTGWAAGTGTYSVNPDCTGEAVIISANNPFPLNLHFVIVNHGKEIKQVVDANAVIATGTKVD